MTATTDWIDKRGFELVLPLPGFGYAPGFDHHAEYQFMRKGWDEPQVFRLSDAHPAFNVAGLYYRPESKS